jgi:hypothetical protein
VENKVPPGTKLTLSIAGLLSLAAILYAANPSPFATVNAPIGVAASTADLIATEYCGHSACGGNGAQELRAAATASQMR